MKKNLLVVFTFILIIGLYFTLQDKEISNENLENNLSSKTDNVVINDVKVNSSSKVEFSSSNFKGFEERKNERDKYPNGIKVTSLDEENLSEERRSILEQKFSNLHKYGNFNQNKLAGEFKNIKKYRRNIDKNYPLSFIPTKNEFLENNFDLTGKYASGSYSKESGFNSYTQLFENKDTKQKIELTEMYLNPKYHTLVKVYKESFNKRINGLDLNFQEIPVGDTNVYTVHLYNNQKMYSLSTIRVDKKDVENLVFSLIEESNQFTN